MPTALTIYAVFAVGISTLFARKLYSPLQKLEIELNAFMEDKLTRRSLTDMKCDILEFRLFADLLLNALKTAQEKRAVECELVEMSKQAAHDIRSPLMALRIALEGMPKVSMEQQKYIDAIVSNINEIAQGMMDKYRAFKLKVAQGAATLTEEGKQYMLSMGVDTEKIRTSANVSDENDEKYIIAEKKKEPVSLLPVAPILEIVFKQKSGELRCHKPKINLTLLIPSDIKVDKLCAKYNPSKLQRILSNLINNSVDAITKTQREEGAIDVVLEQQGNYLAIVIGDNGCGMSPELVTEICRGEYTESENGGHGLGVFSAIQIIESWNGACEIFSMPEQGTRFTICLPFQVI